MTREGEGAGDRGSRGAAPAALDRRALLGAAAGAALLGLLPREARGLGRTPLGGRLSLTLPWSMAALDPHALHDAAAALLAPAVADPLYALDAGGQPYPTLAAALPAQEGNELVVRLREGLRTGRGVALDARDVAASVERARARGAAAILADVPPPRTRPGDPLAVRFAASDSARLARALASPLVALVPRGASPVAPDGTGAFVAEPTPAGMVLRRNVHAARGPAFLDEVVVTRGADLASSLRAFEAGRDDVGWLGAGLHQRRVGARSFDLGRFGWMVLSSGADAGAWGAPGVAQRLLDAVPPERLAHLGLGALPRAVGDPAWGGPPGDVLVDDRSPHLVETARALSSVLSRPGHELAVAPLAPPELARRRASRRYVLLVDVVRAPEPGLLAPLLALAMADDPARAVSLARTPPRALPADARASTRTMRLGVIGELRVSGAVSSEIVLAPATSAGGWDLGASHRRAPPRP